jgi:hypothetical protein
MPYTRFQMPGDRHIVGICSAGDDALAFAVVREDDHPFDLDPAVLDAERTRALRDALTAWLDTGGQLHRARRSSCSEPTTTGRKPV